MSRSVGTTPFHKMKTDTQFGTTHRRLRKSASRERCPSSDGTRHGIQRLLGCFKCLVFIAFQSRIPSPTSCGGANAIPGRSLNVEVVGSLSRSGDDRAALIIHFQYVEIGWVRLSGSMGRSRGMRMKVGSKITVNLALLVTLNPTLGLDR